MTSDNAARRLNPALNGAGSDIVLTALMWRLTCVICGMTIVMEAAMVRLAEQEVPATSAEAAFQKVADLLGGSQALLSREASALDVHERLLHGLSGAALRHLVTRLPMLRDPALLEPAVGMSLRTYQRHMEAPAKPLSREQSGRTWKFAEILAKAIEVLGSQDEAEQWLVRPAMGLEQRRPIDLLATPVGVKLVEDFLQRLEYGVYA